MNEQFEERESRKARMRRLRGQRARKIHQSLSIVFCLTLVVFIAANLLKKDSSFSDSENRMLAQRPEFSFSSIADGSFMKDFESYVSDQFFMRDSWISLKLLEDKLLGKKESNGVYLGKQGYLMEIPDAPDEENLARNLRAIQDFYSRHTDLRISMALIPNSFHILKDKLPANAPVRNQAEDIARITGTLGQSVNFLDVSPALENHADENIYYKTDHHWTTLGAYYAFLSMADGLGISNPIQNYTVYTVANDFSGTLASKSGYHKSLDTVQIYAPQDVEPEYIVTYSDDQTKYSSLYRSECLNDKDKYTVFFGGNHATVDIETPNEDKRVLLVFKDSYANCFIPFLTPYFREIVMIDPRYYYESIDQVIQRKNVTDVLYLYNINTFLGDSSLADTLAADELAQDAQTENGTTTDTGTEGAAGTDSTTDANNTTGADSTTGTDNTTGTD
ncbi:MAG: DHHW family protein, partial [Eubacteriales bacterium]|nr:DHHW family protein [Eubacteriales bacterium]